MRKRILMISPFFSPNTGGVETFLDDLIAYLNRQDQNVDVLTYQPLTTKTRAPVAEKKDGNRIFRLPWLTGKFFYQFEKYALLQLLYLGSGLGGCALFYFLSGKGRDTATVNCHGLAAGFVGYVLSFFIKRRYVLSFHTNYRFAPDSGNGRFVRKMCSRFDRILTLSASCKENLVGLGVPAEKISSYHNWVDQKMFVIQDRKLSRAQLKWNEKDFYAIFIGRFSAEKGIFDLLEAIPFLDKQINLVLIGGGMGEEKVAAVSAQNNKVIFLGRKKAAELVDYCNAADIMVYAPVDEDYLGRAALTALSCGLAIMIPRQSLYMGKRQEVSLVIPDTIGCFFDNSPQAFAKKINDIFSRREQIHFDRAACRRYAEQYYGEEVNGEIIFNTLTGKS